MKTVKTFFSPVITSLDVPGGKAAASRKSVVLFDAEWDDYIVKYYVDGKYQKKADSHHYSDKEDALNTAQSWVNGKF